MEKCHLTLIEEKDGFLLLCCAFQCKLLVINILTVTTNFHECPFSPRFDCDRLSVSHDRVRPFFVELFLFKWESQWFCKEQQKQQQPFFT